MSGIVLSSAVRQNLLALQNTAAQLATTQNDLSTGNKVNSALDNPTNFFTASGLNSRASDISNLLDGISNGVQVLQAANTGLTSLQSLVSQAKSIANQALQTSIGYSTKASVTTNIGTGASASNLLSATSGSVTSIAVDDSGGTNAITANTKLSSLATAFASGDSITVNGTAINITAASTAATPGASDATHIQADDTVGDLLAKIDAISGGTSSIAANGKITLTSGTNSTLSLSSTNAAAITAGLGLTGTAGEDGSAATPVTAGTASNLNGVVLTIPVTPGGSTTSTTATVTFGNSAGDVSTLNGLNSTLAQYNLQATLDSSGNLTITTTNDAASSSFGAVTATNGGAAVTAGSAFYNPTIVSTPVADPASQSTRSSLVSQYNALLTQIDSTASDSSYNGVNLLNGDQLQLTFDETGKSKLNITGVQDSSAGLGLAALSSNAFQDNTSTNAVIANLNTANTTLRSQASQFGSNLSVVQTRQDFNTSLINVLQTGSANLTQADINLEAANSQALNTRQSLSISALSLANQSQQSVLQLLR